MMNRLLALTLMSLSLILTSRVGMTQETQIKIDFRDKSPNRSLGQPWQWLRENEQGWRLSDKGLQVLIEPGNMWGPANDARNVLLYPLAKGWHDAVQITVELTHDPKKRWEQADLVWYYSDSTMVKLGLEIENGVTNIVMGREEQDQAQTIAIIPYSHPLVQLRLKIHGKEIHGYFRNPTSSDWIAAGKTTLPDANSLPPQVSLQFYQGEQDSNRWATVHWIEFIREVE